MKLIKIMLCSLAIFVSASAQQKELPTPQPLSIKTFEERLVKLQRERDQLVANINAYDGAIQECKYWLELLEKQEQSGIKSEEKSDGLEHSNHEVK